MMALPCLEQNPDDLKRYFRLIAPCSLTLIYCSLIQRLALAAAFAAAFFMGDGFVAIASPIASEDTLERSFLQQHGKRLFIRRNILPSFLSHRNFPFFYM
jgi:hypothetical protein